MCDKFRANYSAAMGLNKRGCAAVLAVVTMACFSAPQTQGVRLEWRNDAPAWQDKNLENFTFQEPENFYAFDRLSASRVLTFVAEDKTTSVSATLECKGRHVVEESWNLGESGRIDVSAVMSIQFETTNPKMGIVAGLQKSGGDMRFETVTLGLDGKIEMINTKGEYLRGLVYPEVAQRKIRQVWFALMKSKTDGVSMKDTSRNPDDIEDELEEYPEESEIKFKIEVNESPTMATLLDRFLGRFDLLGAKIPLQFEKNTAIKEELKMAAERTSGANDIRQAVVELKDCVDCDVESGCGQHEDDDCSDGITFVQKTSSVSENRGFEWNDGTAQSREIQLHLSRATAAAYAKGVADGVMHLKKICEDDVECAGREGTSEAVNGTSSDDEEEETSFHITIGSPDAGIVMMFRIPQFDSADAGVLREICSEALELFSQNLDDALLTSLSFTVGKQYFRIPADLHNVFWTMVVHHIRREPKSENLGDPSENGCHFQAFTAVTPTLRQILAVDMDDLMIKDIHRHCPEGCEETD